MLKVIKKTSHKKKIISSKISSLLNKNNKNFTSKLNNDSFINGTSAIYVEQMYHSWRKDSKSVHMSWDSYFSNVEKGLHSSESFQTPPTIDKSFLINDITNKGEIHVQPAHWSSNVEDSLKVTLMIRAYQRFGFLNADIFPLNLISENERNNHFKIFNETKNLDYQSYGFTEQDLEKEFVVKTNQMTGIMSENKPLKLKYILERLQKAYCSTIGIEFMFIHSREECNFLRQKFENEWYNYIPSKEELIEVYDRLAWAVLFEEFLKNKFTTHKRFGLEGLESLISGLKGYVDTAVEHGVKDITLGMPHRGRLNVLANVFRKPMSKIFAEFQGKHGDANETKGSGDVKYHLGTHYTRSYPNGKEINLDILPNPSHLECVNPVVMGKTRAKQHFSNDSQREQHQAILIHGDAAFAGQGVVYESMQMSNLPNYTTGGVLHVVANNQIGFTTTPLDSRSTPFCTDIGKALEAPIIHVNADDPIAVDFVFKAAAEYSARFTKDIIIDIIGYRRHGHNELDQPMFTQPLMYKKIAERENVLKLYEERMLKAGISSKEIEDIKTKVKNLLENYYQDALNDRFEKDDWVPKQWENLSIKKYSALQNTGVDIKKLKELGEKITTIPLGVTPHPQIKKIYEARKESIKEGKGIDWATGESLAWAHLLEEGYTVRLTGQDVERGTFSHRHSIVHDQNDGSKYFPLKQIAKNPQNIQIHNSHLSEFAVLGFELGFSYYNPDSLCMWEAQFGDFVNGAQVIIDQFLTSGESKWNVQSGLVLLLPHGMDGQGAEHSSCRIERFLESMDDDPRKIPNINESVVFQIRNSNLQICNPTSAANYFHALIRQLKRQFRKPLIIPSPKKLLRFKGACSNIEEFAENLKYIKVRSETNPEIVKNAKKVKKLLICSGQVYYDLVARREKVGRKV